MSIQECALYGDLVLHLRDRTAKMLNEARPNSSLEAELERIDTLIQEWFFAPQDELYDSTPRDVIWREQLGQGNPIPPKYAHDAFDEDCDCPICREAIAEIEAGEHNHSHAQDWHWTYCPESTLIDAYDPEGSAERWEKERVRHQPQLDLAPLEEEEIPIYTPPATKDMKVSPEEFMERLNLQAQVDDELKQLAKRLAERFDCPITKGSFFGPDYRRLSHEECAALLKGLDEHGVDLDELVEQIEAWPYLNIAVDWLSEPERHAYFAIQSMETRLDPAAKGDLIRFRQHRDFHFILCQLIPYNARLWLQGWLEGLALGNLPELERPNC